MVENKDKKLHIKRGISTPISMDLDSYYFGVLKTLEVIEKQRLIVPDENSLTQFAPYYIIEKELIEEFKRIVKDDL